MRHFRNLQRHLQDISNKNSEHNYENLDYLHGLTKEEFDKSVPVEPDQFYQDLGLLQHQMTKEPVEHLTQYQQDVWNNVLRHKYNLVIKSQKVGLTTSALMMDFQFAVLPLKHPCSCRGGQILLIAQSLQQAREHLTTLRKIILQSKKYRGFLISRPSEVLLKDEVTKVTVIYVKNPDNPFSPTRIIGLGASEGAIWSWKEVKFVHISDIAASNKDYTGTINAAMTRLANSNGRMLIESPPRGPNGRLYEIYRDSLLKTDTPEGQFKITTIHVREAIEAGVVTQEFVDSQREILGSLFSQYYEAAFIASGGNVYQLQDIEKAEMQNYAVKPNMFSAKSLGIDPAFGSSRFAFVVTQLNNGAVEILEASEYDRPSPDYMLSIAWELYSKYKPNKIFVDGSNPAFIKSLKQLIGEDVDYDRITALATKQKMRKEDLMTVIPKNFGTEGREMLGNSQYLLSKGLLKIDKRFNDLLVQMRSAIEVNGSLDKSTNSLDLIDALRLSLSYYQMKEQEI